MSDQVEVRLIVGRYDGEVDAVVAGCIDRGAYDVDGEVSDNWVKRIKEDFAGPTVNDYEWREVDAHFDQAALNALFEASPIRGSVAS